MSNVKENDLKISDFLRIKEASDFLGVPPSTLRKWDNSGKLKAIRHPLNGYRLYHKESLLKILDEITKRA